MDELRVRHDQIGGTRGNRRAHLGRPVEVLADLQRRGECLGNAGAARQIVGEHRLLDPLQPLVIEGLAARHRLRQAERLVVVDHERD